MVTLSAQLGFGSKPRAGIARLVVAGAVIAGLALSGCAKTSNTEPTTLKPTTQTSVEPEPTETTPLPEETTPNPTQEPSAAPTPPDPAQLINENTEEGAKSAAVYFLRLQNYVLVSANSDLWRTQTSADCQFCNDTIQMMLQLSAEDLDLQGGVIEVLAINSVEEEWPNIWVVELMISEEPITLQRANGEIVSVLESSSELVRVIVSFAGDTWLLEELTN